MNIEGSMGVLGMELRIRLHDFDGSYRDRVMRYVMVSLVRFMSEQGGPPAVFVEGCGQQPGVN